MTWTPLTVLPRVEPCPPPFSFYFDIIEPFWRTRPAENMSLHRLATLARKQDVTAVVIDDASGREDVRAELLELDGAFGGGGSAEAVSFTFLRSPAPHEPVADLPEDALIGQCVLINYKAPNQAEFTSTYIFEAIFCTPRARNGDRLLNNHIEVEGDFAVEFRGRSFGITGVCYSQQNEHTSVCAHANIRMVLRTLDPTMKVGNAQMNAAGGVENAKSGMKPGQIAEILSKLGGLTVDRISCRGLKPEEYISILTAATESGDLALLVFRTVPDAENADASAPPPENHVVLVLGNTRNSDEWHPQALPAYVGEASSKYSPASAWVDHLVIHDDNFGPYFTLSSRALEVDPDVHPRTILIIRRKSCDVEAHVAETAASSTLSQVLPSLTPFQSPKWLRHVTERPRKFVTRPILLNRGAYRAHLERSVPEDADGSVLLGAVDQLPERFWMVEFTLADLLTGNHAKLGEVLIQPEWTEPVEKDRRDLVIAIRVPGAILVRKEGVAMVPTQSPILSHSPIFRLKPHGNEW